MKEGRTKNSRVGRDSSPSAQIDLTPFCDDSGANPWLAAPWTAGGFTYATDGRVLVRTAALPGAAGVEHPMTRPAVDYFASQPLPLPPDLESLPKIVAKMTVTVRCRECCGSGAVLNAKNKPALCPRCQGEKAEFNSRSIPIGKRCFAAGFLALIATLPSVRIAPTVGDVTGPMRFVFEGGEGLVMPRKPQS